MRFLDIFKYKKAKYSLYIFFTSFLLSLIIFPTLFFIDMKSSLFIYVYSILKILSVPLFISSIYFILLLSKTMVDADYLAEATPEQFAKQVYKKMPVIYILYVIGLIISLILFFATYTNIIPLGESERILKMFIGEFMFSSSIMAFYLIKEKI